MHPPGTLSFRDYLATALVVETLMLILFRVTRSPFTGRDINHWYDKFRLTAVFMDMSSYMLGYYISRSISGFWSSWGSFALIVLIVQISHDLLFYHLVLKPFPMNRNDIMDDLKDYADNVGVGAVIGDSFMYLIGLPILYQMQHVSTFNKEFVSLACLYLIGYLIYQKPLPNP